LPGTSDFEFDVFLSHSAEDKALVRVLAERLRRDGLKLWFDEWTLKPGDFIPTKIEEGLEHSRVLVLCMSANAFGSDWARLEADTFRFRDPLNKERRFIPLRLDDAKIKGSLAQFIYINWRTADREVEYAKLLEACRSPPQPEEPETEVAQMQVAPETISLMQVPPIAISFKNVDSTEVLLDALKSNRGRLRDLKAEYTKVILVDGGIQSAISNKRRLIFYEIMRIYAAMEGLKNELMQRGAVFDIDVNDYEHPNAAFKRLTAPVNKRNLFGPMFWYLLISMVFLFLWFFTSDVWKQMCTPLQPWR
jgi:hypothetical protein